MDSLTFLLNASVEDACRLDDVMLTDIEHGVVASIVELKHSTPFPMLELWFLSVTAKAHTSANNRNMSKLYQNKIFIQPSKHKGMLRFATFIVNRIHCSCHPMWSTKMICNHLYLAHWIHDDIVKKQRANKQRSFLLHWMCTT